jgi:aldose sugar dehydrogenase
MARKGFWIRMGTLFVALSLLMSFTSTNFAAAQEAGPEMLNPRLGVRPVVTGLELPTTMAFIGSNEFFVLEKNTGRVQRVVDGAVESTVLDLAVNNFSERGLLGIALDPDFESNGFVYLYWSCIAPPPPAENPFFPTQTECAETPETGSDIPDSEDVLAVPLLGNRVDRFVWDGEMLTFDLNLIMLRAFQHDAAPEPPNQGDEAQPPRGNHDGGVLAFGQDGKLYIFIGDVGRRGQLQNLPCGPTDVYNCPGEDEMVPDDQFGGPEPDDAHLTGVVLRLNPDGSTPEDNPFFEAGAAMGGEVGENIQKVFSYGHRNSFGMAVDPVSGNLWLEENGDDSFSEINRVVAGMNGGWIQVAGPIKRINQFKEIETTFFAPPATLPALQQLRWPPSNIADTPVQARSRLFMLPGAQYKDPAFSWKWEVAPASLNFLMSKALGPQFQNDLFVGAATPQLEGGYLFHFDLTSNRRGIDPNNPRLQDLVADNTAKHDITESESLLIGRNFGAITDIETGPNGNLFVVSLTNGTVYEIFRLGGGDDTVSFSTELTGAAEVPGPGDPDGSGMATITLSAERREVCFELTVSGIASATAAHIHEGAPDVAGPVVVPLDPPPTNGSSSACISGVDRALVRNIIQHPERYYVNVHNVDFPNGAIRGQLSQ